MKITEIHDRFVLLAQQMGMKTVRAILSEQIDELINTESINYVRDIFSRKGNRELDGISDNVIRLNELDPLLVNRPIVSPRKTDITFGKGYRINTTVFIPQIMYLISVSSLTGDVLAKCRLIEIDYVPQTQNDYHSKSVVVSPICYKLEDGIEVIGNFDVTKFIVTYIKYPTLVNLETDTTNELSDIAMQKVIERAVNTYNAISNNDSYERVSNELSKLE